MDEDIYLVGKEQNDTVIYYFLLNLWEENLFYFGKVTKYTSTENDWKEVVGFFPLNIFIKDIPFMLWENIKVQIGDSFKGFTKPSFKGLSKPWID